MAVREAVRDAGSGTFMIRPSSRDCAVVMVRYEPNNLTLEIWHVVI